MFSRWGKTYALLWLCFLMVGPSYVRLRAFLKCVKGFCTDLGTERQVPDVPDCLIDFCKSINLRVPASATPQPFLFPGALLLCGWHHLFDGLIRFGLCSLGWFKPFLKQLKILNKFCRDHSGYLFDLLIERGYHGAAFIIKKISHTTFAEWRWRKMDRVVSGVNKFLDVLAFTPVLAIVLEYVRNSKDRESVWKGTVLFVLQCKLFRVRLNFSAWFTIKFTRMEQWGSSCPCHRSEWELGIQFDCDRRGRILPFAFQYVCDSFASILAEVSGWTVNTWSSDITFLTEVSGATRATVARGKIKTGFIDRIPYLFAHLGFVPGVREREQWRSFTALPAQRTTE